MLFTDADPIDFDDLNAIDPEISTTDTLVKNLAPIQGPGSFIARAVELVGRELEVRNQSYSGYMSSAPGMTANLLWAVMNTNQTGINRPRFMLNQVVVQEPNPTKTYISDIIKQQAMLYFFQALAHRKTADERYEKKMAMYRDEVKRAWERLDWSGTPVVLVPFPCPGAIREYASGTWDTGNVTAGGSGSTETGNAYDVVVTWTGQLYKDWAHPINGGESASSATVTVEATAGQVLTVDISTLNPPNGTMPAIGVANGLYTTVAAFGWNVWASVAGGTPTLQNASPLPLGTTSYTLPDVPTATNKVVGRGQAPDYYITYMKTLGRA